MYRTIWMLSLAICMVSIPNMAHADLNTLLKNINKQALSDINNFNKKLGKQFGLPTPDVEAIIKSVPKPEDAFMILQLGQMSHKSPEEVLQKYKRNKGKAWGTLARELGIKPGSPEFHALKRGDLPFTGEAREKDSEHRHHEHEKRKDKDKKKEKHHGRDENDGLKREKGKGRDKD